jgi:hypothetical protein
MKPLHLMLLGIAAVICALFNVVALVQEVESARGRSNHPGASR